MSTTRVVLQPDVLLETSPRWPHDPPHAAGECNHVDVVEICNDSGGTHGAVCADLHYPGACSGQQPRLILHVRRPDGSVQLQGVTLTQAAALRDLIALWLDVIDQATPLQQVTRVEPDPRREP